VAAESDVEVVVSRLLVRRSDPEPVTCTGCGTPFRAAYTGGRCPICDRVVDGYEASGGRLARVRDALGEGWSAGLLLAAVVANVVIFVLVAIAASR
jgi:hypothetical protein